MTDTFHYKDTTLGVLGGMGPLASAQFIRTIYQLCDESNEFHFPKIRLVSEPDIPDRTLSIQTSATGDLEHRIVSLLSSLEPHVDRLLICCFTAHTLVPNFPEHIRRKLISLVDYSDQLLRQLNQRTLFIATEGVYQRNLFPAQDYPGLVMLQSEDLRTVHRLIYRQLKTGHDYAQVEIQLADLLKKYECSQVFGGCTEMHLLKMWERCTLPIIDPLYEVALDFAGRKLAVS